MYIWTYKYIFRNKVKRVSLTKPAELESMVPLIFFTPSRSNSHPPHGAVSNDSNSRTVGDMIREKATENESHNCWKLSVVCSLFKLHSY